MDYDNNFHNRLCYTCQLDNYHTDAKALPKEVYDKLLESKCIFFKEWACSGGGVKLELEGINIENRVYDITFTVDYSQDFSVDYPGLEDEDIEKEMLKRAEEFLIDGLEGAVYLEHKEDIEL